MSRRHESPDSSVHGNSAPVQRLDHHDHGGKWFALVALFVAILSLVVAVMALDAKELAEARYADIVARHAATAEDARLAERDATVAVERSHDLMERVTKLEIRAGILTTERH